MNIIVTGAAGLLGVRLVIALSHQHHVTAVIHESAFPFAPTGNLSIETCDLTDNNAVRRLMQAIHADVVVNSAAMTDVDRCEDNRLLATELNCGIVANLLEAIDHGRTRFLQISTDYLFDGKSGPYSEGASANPLNAYGRTKLSAEELVKKWSGASLIVRTSALFDSAGSSKTNLFTAIFNRLTSNESVDAASDLFCNPIWTLNLSQAIMEVIDSELTGIINIAGSEYMSRHDFAVSVANSFRLPVDLIRAVPIASLNRRAKRPLKAGVDIAKASHLLQTRLLSPVEVFAATDFMASGKK